MPALPSKRADGTPSSAPAQWVQRHIWEIQPVRDVLMVLGVLGVLWLGYQVRIVTAPLLAAVTLAYLFEPVIRKMECFRWCSRQGSAVAVLAIVLCGVLVPLAALLVYAAAQSWAFIGRNYGVVRDFALSLTGREGADSAAARLPERWAGFRERVQEAMENEAVADEAALVVQRMHTFFEANASAVASDVVGKGAGLLSTAAGFVTSTGALLFSVFLAGFFFFFVSTGYGRLLVFWQQLIPDRKRGKAIELLQKMDAVVSGFVRGRLTICTIQCVFFSLAYWLIGVPAPIAVGVLVGALSLVPYVALLGIPLTVLMLLLEPAGTQWQAAWWWVVGAPVLVYMVGQVLDDYVLSPIIQGKSTGMDTPTIMFASLAGGSLAGMYGLLLAIPVAACVKILLVEVLWPRIELWTKGETADPLPLGGAKE